SSDVCSSDLRPIRRPGRHEMQSLRHSCGPYRCAAKETETALGETPFPPISAERRNPCPRRKAVRGCGTRPPPPAEYEWLPIPASPDGFSLSYQSKHSCRFLFVNDSMRRDVGSMKAALLGVG